MDCPDDNALTAFAAGRLSPEEAAELEAHLDTCDLCRQLVGEALQDDEAPASDADGALHDEDDDDDALSGPLEPGTRVGRYLVLEQAGAGAMGTVFRAYDPTLERNVALKLLHVPTDGSEDAATLRARLLQEAQAMARLNHPNVVTVHDVGAWRDRVFLAMEYVEGQTLRSWMQEPGRPLQERLETLIAAGRGLAAAHAAGLIHRDFKPDNVLIGRDGRVCVTDFGLARPKTGALEVPVETHPSEVHASVSERLAAAEASIDSTQSGIIVGTPAYMAPEQLSGRPADASTDQFSFCVTAWEALLGERPFDLGELRQLAVLQLNSTRASPGDERRRSPRLPGGPGVPSSLPTHLGKSLLRGLSADPGSRFGSLEALLTALTDDPAKRRRQRLQMVAVATVLLVSGSALAWQQHEAAAARCTGGAAMVSEFWNPDVRKQLVRAFQASGVEEGPAFAKEVVRLLDGYGARWSGKHREACEATRIRGEQTEEELSLRMGCLSRRRGEYRELVRLLASGEADAVAKSVDAASGLSGLALCENLEALREPIPSPTSPEAVAAIEEVTELLAAGTAQRLAGRFEPSLAFIQKAARVMGGVRHRPTEAEVLYEEGFVRSRLGQREEAHRLLLDAVTTADAGRFDHLKIRAALRLTYLESWQQDGNAEQWLQFAEAALERIGGDPELRGELAGLRAIQLRAAGRLADALAANREALRRFTEVLGPTHPKTAILQANMADVMLALGQTSEAVPLLTASIASTEVAAGPEHPRLLAPLTTLSSAQVALGQYDAGIGSAQRAQRIAAKVLGEESGRAADQLDYLGTAYQAAGRFTDALKAYGRALTLHRQLHGAAAPESFYALDGVGQSLAGLGRLDEARAHLEDALALPMTPSNRYAPTELALARVLLQQGERDAALRLAQRAAQHFVERQDAAHAAEAQALMDALSPETPLRRVVEEATR